MWVRIFDVSDDLTFRIIDLLLYLSRHVYKRLSHSPSSTVCYIYVTHYPYSSYKFSICGYLGSETTFQNLDKPEGYKAPNIQVGI